MSDVPADSSDDDRVLVFAPIGRDAALTESLLTSNALRCKICGTIGDVVEALEQGAGALLLTEETLDERALPDLASALQSQPAWSDIPVLLFAGGDRSQALLRTLTMLETLGNVTLLDRPIRVAAVLSTIRAALRARRRQYELRDVLVALHGARDDAERANRLKDEFLATLSHELRTPLNAILGWVSMLRHTAVPPERQAYVYEVIERNALAQTQLIGDVLDVSRIITGRLRLTRTEVDVPLLVSTAVDSIRPAADARGLRLAVDIARSVKEIVGDRERLQQVLWNLLSNAVKFTPPGGTVTVRAVAVVGGVEIAIADTGVGVSAEFLPFAFDRFRQADQSFTREHGGLGLGLAIVKHIVELHGGRVSAESAGANQGTTFRVFLPSRSEKAVDERPSPAAGAAEALDLDLAGRSILVVDDDPSTRELLFELLTHCHATVTIAASAEAVFETLQQSVPTLLIADIGMPGQDGIAMIREIRRLPPDRGGRVPAIALSAYARAEDRSTALRAGFSDFVAKPARPEDVLRAVQQLLP
jgi:signal transduction histidine kinase/ActR/RegA family two-component response regulator